MVCQQYTALSSIEARETTRALEQDIKSIELKLLTQNDPGLVMNLQDKRHELRSFLHERVKGVLINVSLCYPQDRDAASTFLLTTRTVVIATQTDSLPSSPCWQGDHG